MPSLFRTLVLLLACAPGALHAQNVVLPLWPEGVPNETGPIEPETVLEPRPRDVEPVPRITNVSEPRMEVYLPAPDKRTGTAVVVAPGGGYNILAVVHEGSMVVDWLNGLGVAAIMLKYRVPRRNGRAKHAAPLEDAQRAMSLVRRHAEDWGIDPNRIGLLGFSAGGHLTLTAGTTPYVRTYDLDPDIDRFSCRPDFLIPVYPAYLVEEGDQGRLPPEIRITPSTPPTFLVHAHDDPYSAVGSARVYVALKEAGVPAELHIYARGGHGFGMWPSEFPASSWPRRAEEWMRSLGFLN